MYSRDDIIHSYTRANAIADGVLIDVSEVAREAGFTVPVAVTHGVWARCVAVPEGAACQDEAGRLWDVLWLARCAARAGGDGSEVRFVVYVRIDNRGPRPVRLKATCGPGDAGEAVVTVMMEGED
jgi:hypothetical protein